MTRLFLSLLLCGSLNAANWYVEATASSPDDSAGGGTLANRPGSLTNAVNATGVGWATGIAAGDTIWMGGGVLYSGTFLTVARSGSAGSLIVFRNKAYEYPKLDAGIAMQASYVRFIGLECYLSRWTGRDTAFSGQDASDLRYGSSQPDAVEFSGSRVGVQFINCYFHDLFGGSIHGEGVLKLSEQINNSDTMIETEVTLPEGAVFEIEGKKYTVKDGLVIPMVEEEAEVEMAEEAPVEMMEEPKEEEVEMAAETEDPAAVEAVETPQGEIYTKETIDARFQEMMDIIAEMKAAATPVEMEQEAEPNVQMSAEKSEVQKKIDLISAWNRGKEVMAIFKNK